MSSTLIIDADDTLWENNIHYEAAIDRFLELLSCQKNLERPGARYLDEDRSPQRPYSWLRHAILSSFA